MATTVSREALSDLRGKYSEMLAMRRAHERGQGDKASARARMALLSLRFPGALREIDDLELREIERRVAALDAVLRDGGEVAGWMEALVRFHSLARGVLCAKRWLAGRKAIDSEAERAYAAALPTLEFPQDARGWSGELARIASPPRGRLTDVVFARLALELGIEQHAARRLVFGIPRRER